jgi:membrane-associated protease RseP (regulator of RpoE activity)
VKQDRIWLHILLFFVTLFTTTIAGVAWVGKDPFELENFGYGLEYSLLLLLFLSAHEFGHYFAARYHKVDTTFPYYIPFPGTMMGIMPNFGTFGAVIRVRSQLPSRKVTFDIGVAGPIAGFIVCVAVLIIGFATLPGIEYLQQIHPGYPNVPRNEFGELSFGKTILYAGLEKIFANPSGYVPPMTEMYHYPFLCVGWFGLFVTALNMLPVGQLDGGHIGYAMFPKRVHKIIGIVLVVMLSLIALPELYASLFIDGPTPSWLEPLIIPGGSSWIAWILLIIFVIRFSHPAVPDTTPLDTKRMVIGVVAFIIFVLSFTPSPVVLQ